MSKTVYRPEDLPDVRKYLDSEERLQRFKAENYDFFQRLEELLEERNTLLQAADKAVRATTGGECGPFRVTRTTVEYDAEKLYEELGREDFLKVGGKIESRTIFDLDKNKVEAAIARQDIPEEVVREFRATKIAYTGPKPVKLP